MTGLVWIQGTDCTERASSVPWVYNGRRVDREPRQARRRADVQSIAPISVSPKIKPADATYVACQLEPPMLHANLKDDASSRLTLQHRAHCSWLCG